VSRTQPLLDVRHLSVSFNTPDGIVEAVRNISFSVDRGKTLAIVGESGSGKSVATQSTVGLTRGARISGAALFDNRDLLKTPPGELRSLRGRDIAMIFQNPLSSLHPFYKIGWQIVEAIQAHEAVSAAQARSRAIDLLSLVGIPRPERRVDDYPHQFSGGMLQRVMIAMALCLNPRLIIADEPTTALDVTVQAQILKLMRRLQAEFGSAIILITHDLGVVADNADDVMVMYAGQAMEHAPVRELFRRPGHPYTSGLLASLPRTSASRSRLVPIAGQPPSLIDPPHGCPFHPRCSRVLDRCASETPPLTGIVGRESHEAACWLHDSLTQ